MAATVGAGGGGGPCLGPEPRLLLRNKDMRVGGLSPAESLSLLSWLYALQVTPQQHPCEQGRMASWSLSEAL